MHQSALDWARAAELLTPVAEPTFMGMREILTPVYWTADMARLLPEDGNRYEVVYGELLVTPPLVCGTSCSLAACTSPWPVTS